MSPEEQRDQWLKRILPGLMIGVLYGVFARPLLSGNTDKARQEYESLMTRGIAAELLPGMQQQLSEARQQITVLKQEDQKMHSELSSYAGFLAQGGSANTATEQIAALFAEHRLRVIEEKRDEKAAPTTFTKSLRDTHKWLLEALQWKGVPTVMEVHFAGTYLDTYRAMAVLAEGKIAALPVSLTMQEWKNAGNGEDELLEWRLKLWI